MARPVSERDQALRRLPKIDEVLAREDIAVLSSELPRWSLRAAVRGAVDARRRAILAADASGTDALAPWAPTAQSIESAARSLCAPSLRRLVNATGVVLHTNFGRAPLPEAALAALDEAGRGYTNLEYDVAAGRRGSRHGHLLELVRELTGAEDAAVVNNNAAATMLGLTALAAGREVIVSRGELVEIGGSFRIPDVMRLSGATLVEVGTTNKTRLADYASAITANSGLLLKVHRSNFAVVGFSEETPCSELAELGRERKVATMYDLGSGSLLGPGQMASMGLPSEEGVADVVRAGVDLVTFSGDKLLGGPQAGLLAGRKTAVNACRKHPLMRALRPDKLTIAALGATLALYRDAGVGRPPQTVPTMAMLGEPLTDLRRRGETLLGQVQGALRLPITAELISVDSAVGGGAMPLASLPSWGIALCGVGASVIDADLRSASVPVVGRSINDIFVLDIRTIDEREYADVARAVASIGCHGDQADLA